MNTIITTYHTSKALLSKGISDIASNEAINKQMKAKFPSHKMAIPSPTEAQWNEERTSIDREILRTTIMKLKSQVSPGLSCFRYEHLQAILFSEHSKADRLAKSAFDELRTLYLMTSSRADYRGTSTRSGMVQA